MWKRQKREPNTKLDKTNIHIIIKLEINFTREI